MWFPTALLVLFVIAVLVEVSGSSTGIWAHVLWRHADPDLLAGTPRRIRSDEWLVQGSWLVSQTHQGFPVMNQVFPGGMDASAMNDAPTWDWSSLFRPHLWGSLLLGLDHGMAFRWWSQALLVLSSAYAFVVTALPRRPALGAVIAAMVFFQPIVQWWWFPALTTPLFFAFATMTAAMWALRAASTFARVVPAVVAGYAAVDMGMSIYVPFMLACGYPVVAFVLGKVVAALRSESMGVRELARRFGPLVASGAGAVGVLALWAVTRYDTISAILGTAYPGHRLVPTGFGFYQDFVTLFSAPFDRALTQDIWAGLGSNQSTAAAPFMVSLFVLVPLLWLAVTRWRRNGPDWPVLAVLAVHVLLFAIIFLPGWDAIAHWILADRSPTQRLRLAFVVLMPISVVLLGERLDRDGYRVRWPVALLPGLAALSSFVWVWRWLEGVSSPTVPSAYAVVVAVTFAVGLVMLGRQRLLSLGAWALLAGTVVVSSGANPLYRGVFDASTDTAAGRAVHRIASSEPDAAWVGLGSWISTGTLFEAGVRAYSGVQTYPSLTMWRQIDPGGTHEFAWNRLAHVEWFAGSGDPRPRQPATGQPDTIELTFDSCAAFAQAHVSYVLADGPPVEQRCLEQIASFQEGRVRERIYRVVKAG